MGLTKIPYNFKKVSGHFDISGNCLATFDNCPEIAGSFDCSNNPYLIDDGENLPRNLTGKSENLFQARNNRSLANTLAQAPDWVKIRSGILKYLNEQTYKTAFSGLDNDSLTSLQFKLDHEQKFNSLTNKLPEIDGIF